MSTQRELFFKHLAQTSPFPPALEIVRGEGCLLYDTGGKQYLDMISGISVSAFGHSNARINKAIHEQVDKHLHLMVYGEYIVSPQVELVAELCKHLPVELQSVYLTNSGTEATEGAMKLAKRFTGRTGIISFRNAYHGSTQGSLSICGNESLKNAYRPLLPDTTILEINNTEQLALINENTAAVFIEPIQAEAGVRLPENKYLHDLRKRCTEKKALLVFDEIQTGMGRTGSLYAFQNLGITPDILLTGKAFGGGMPLGAFVSSPEIMSVFTHNPMLGHLTTSGGHPVSCAAAIAALRIVTEGTLLAETIEKEKLIRSLLKHASIKEIRGKGLFLAVDFEEEERVQQIIARCFDKGLLTDWFLFCPSSMRIAPPLTITKAEIRQACQIITESIGT